MLPRKCRARTDSLYGFYRRKSRGATTLGKCNQATNVGPCGVFRGRLWPPWKEFDHAADSAAAPSPGQPVCLSHAVELDGHLENCYHAGGSCWPWWSIVRVPRARRALNPQ